MKLWNTIEEPCLALTRTLLTILGLLDGNGELACNAPFLCCEAPLPADLALPHQS